MTDRRAIRLNRGSITPENGGDSEGSIHLGVEHVFFELEFVERGQVHS